MDKGGLGLVMLMIFFVLFSLAANKVIGDGFRELSENAKSIAGLPLNKRFRWVNGKIEEIEEKTLLECLSAVRFAYKRVLCNIRIELKKLCKK